MEFEIDAIRRESCSTLLQHAVLDGDEKQFEQALTAITSKPLYRVDIIDLHTSLQLAVVVGRVSMINKLVDVGARVSGINPHYHTLHWVSPTAERIATHQGNLKLVIWNIGIWQWNDKPLFKSINSRLLPLI